MDRRQDQVVVVQRRRSRLGAGGVRRIERELGQEALARDVGGSDRRELREVAGARRRVVVEALELRLVPVGDEVELRRPRAPFARRSAPTARATSAGQPSAAAAGGANARSASQRLGRRRDRVEQPRRRRRADARQQAQRRESPRSGSRGFSAQRRIDSTSLTCAASRKRRPPNLTNGMSRRPSSSSSCALWLDVRNSTACALSAMPISRCSSTRSATQRAWSASSRTVTSSRLLASSAARSTGSWRERSRARPITALDASRIGCGRAVVALQRHHARGRRERLREVEDVAHRRRAERVDRLRVVADDGDAAPVGFSARRIDACSRLVSWYSSTRTWSKRAPTSRGEVGLGDRARPSTAAGRRSRGRSAPASRRRRRRTAPSARAPTPRTTERPPRAPRRAAPRC